MEKKARKNILERILIRVLKETNSTSFMCVGFNRKEFHNMLNLHRDMSCTLYDVIFDFSQAFNLDNLTRNELYYKLLEKYDCINETLLRLFKEDIRRFFEKNDYMENFLSNLNKHSSNVLDFDMAFENIIASDYDIFHFLSSPFTWRMTTQGFVYWKMANMDFISTLLDMLMA